MRIILVWAVLNWLKSGSNVGCGENNGLKWFTTLWNAWNLLRLKNKSLKKCSAAASLWESLQWMLTLWSSGFNTIWIVTLRWELLLPPSGWRLKVVVLLTVTPCNRRAVVTTSSDWPACYLSADGQQVSPFSSKPDPMVFQPKKTQSSATRMSVFFVISVYIVCVCLYPILLYAL